ncbi:MAG: serine/threonine protein kinase, partial [Deltaproteobacteria bacterium]|nr:serine/threonine protein kinase [Deltaproteobacteria bacterium]
MSAIGPSTVLGSYRLLAPLGQGGMGQVWRAEHVQLGRPAAVKVIRPDVPDEARARMTERFAREAKATAALTSQHTVTVHDFGTTP